jgi:hypothetical protein
MRKQLIAAAARMMDPMNHPEPETRTSVVFVSNREHGCYLVSADDCDIDRDDDFFLYATNLVVNKIRYRVATVSRQQLDKIFNGRIPVPAPWQGAWTTVTREMVPLLSDTELKRARREMKKRENEKAREAAEQKAIEEAKIIHTFPVYHRGWELDSKGWVKECADGTRILVMTTHDAPYVARPAVLENMIAEYQRTVADCKLALKLLKGKAK